MIQIHHRSAIIFSGMVWLVIGILLLYKGLQYLTVVPAGAPLAGMVSKWFGSKPAEGTTILMCIALLLGIAKGRLAMRRTVERVVARIRKMPSPFPLKGLYSRGYLILMGLMMSLGWGFKFLPLPVDVKGFLDCLIGAALINGAMLYVKEAFIYRKASLE